MNPKHVKQANGVSSEALRIAVQRSLKCNGRMATVEINKAAPIMEHEISIACAENSTQGPANLCGLLSVQDRYELCCLADPTLPNAHVRPLHGWNWAGAEQNPNFDVRRYVQIYVKLIQRLLGHRKAA